MKKIFFGPKDEGKHVPFWYPWEWGYLGKWLLFLFLLILLLAILSLFGGTGHMPGHNGGLGADPGWNQPIPDGQEVGLPSPEENKLPPFESMTPVPNPGNGGATEIYPNLLYVIFNSDTNDETFKTFAKKFSELYPAPENKIEYYNTGSKTAVLSVPEDKRDEICSNLPSEITEIEFYVVPVEIMTQSESALPDDPAFRDAQKTWYFSVIQAFEAWEITKGSPDIIVGIVDSYMDLNHPELKGDRCISPYSVVDGGSDVAPKHNTPADYAGHGTMVTSIAVGNMNNKEGSSGIAPNCKFIPVSMGSQLNTITEVEGLLYCIYHGASVINLSCGTSFPQEITGMSIDQQIQFSKEYGIAQEKMWDYVYKLADERNVTIVWAAGNDNCFTAMDVSKRNANTIRVSAIDRNLKKADFSNYGNFRENGSEESTISAPGVDIWGALPNNSYDAWPGTSFSAPIIAGVTALIKSQNKDLTSKQIIDILKATGKPVEGHPEIGNLVQIKDALIKAKEIVSSAKNINE